MATDFQDLVEGPTRNLERAAANFETQVTAATKQLGRASPGDPVTRTKTTFSFSIFLSVGGLYVPFGGCDAFEPQQTQTVKECWEINSLSRGIPRYLAPTNIQGRQLTLHRFELWSAPLEQLLGPGGEILMLSDLKPEISIRTISRAPSGVDSDFLSQLLGGGGDRSIYEYQGCRFQSMGFSQRIEERRVGMNATVVFRRKIRLL